jgi:hypothetical protein
MKHPPPNALVVGRRLFELREGFWRRADARRHGRVLQPIDAAATTRRASDGLIRGGASYLRFTSTPAGWRRESSPQSPRHHHMLHFPD